MNLLIFSHDFNFSNNYKMNTNLVMISRQNISKNNHGKGIIWEQETDPCKVIIGRKNSLKQVLTFFPFSRRESKGATESFFIAHRNESTCSLSNLCD